MVDLVTNGSFEEGIAAAPFIVLGAGSAGLPGWKVIGNTIDAISTLWEHADGNRSLDLNGSPGRGGVAQTIRTEVGADYTLGFALAGNPAFQEEHRLVVRIGDEKFKFRFDSAGQSNGDMGWETELIAFTATEKRTKIVFRGDPDNDSFGPALDAVSVMPVSVDELFA